jgi:hypothetical protein
MISSYKIIIMLFIHHHEVSLSFIVMIISFIAIYGFIRVVKIMKKMKKIIKVFMVRGMLMASPIAVDY